MLYTKRAPPYPLQSLIPVDMFDLLSPAIVLSFSNATQSIAEDRVLRTFGSTSESLTQQGMGGYLHASCCVVFVLCLWISLPFLPKTRHSRDETIHIVRTVTIVTFFLFALITMINMLCKK